MIWRVILIFASLCVAVGACYWLGDPTTAEVALMVSLMNHPFFSLSAVAIGMLKLTNKWLILPNKALPFWWNIQNNRILLFYFSCIISFWSASTGSRTIYICISCQGSPSWLINGLRWIWKTYSEAKRSFNSVINRYLVILHLSYKIKVNSNLVSNCFSIIRINQRA